MNERRLHSLKVTLTVAAAPAATQIAIGRQARCLKSEMNPFKRGE